MNKKDRNTRFGSQSFLLRINENRIANLFLFFDTNVW